MGPTGPCFGTMPAQRRPTPRSPVPGGSGGLQSSLDDRGPLLTRVEVSLGARLAARLGDDGQPDEVQSLCSPRVSSGGGRRAVRFLVPAGDGAGEVRAGPGGEAAAGADDGHRALAVARMSRRIAASHIDDLAVCALQLMIAGQPGREPPPGIRRDRRQGEHRGLVRSDPVRVRAAQRPPGPDIDHRQPVLQLGVEVRRVGEGPAGQERASR